MKKHCVGKCKFSGETGTVQDKTPMHAQSLQTGVHVLVKGPDMYTAGELPNICLSPARIFML